MDSIQNYIDKQGNKPFMISELANEINRTYDTTKDYLLHLAALGELAMKKIGRHWIFWKDNKASRGGEALLSEGSY